MCRYSRPPSGLASRRSVSAAGDAPPQTVWAVAAAEGAAEITEAAEGGSERPPIAHDLLAA